MDSKANAKLNNELEVFKDLLQKTTVSKPKPINKKEESKLRDAKEKAETTTESIQSKRVKKKEFRPKKPYAEHPGHVEELEPGAQLANGMFAGQEQALLYISYFEKPLAEKLERLSPEELKERFSQELYWFQRVGNFRKTQKCQSIQKMQKEFGLQQVSTDKCTADIIETEKVEWGDQ